eukprot:CAMPEP_0172391410 /NCGR_PEP_ID=MMETSP1061-20121228/7817_1 /TAXON_ID=37318 /ORGANISM="Pseudo-nitzschia pungens, Strain cf. pungens" /LENGTH=301 /DNA_ID=CAMNT_0013122023 /DNA_START=28 /DNA_END=933 /DNA_ORIENTATION=-
MTTAHDTSTNNKVCIPGLVREAYYEGSSRKAGKTPILIKSIINRTNGKQHTGDDDATTVHFEWTTTGSFGDFYVIRAVGEIKWVQDSRKQFVAQGLEVECTCPNGEKQSIIAKSIGKIVVCKHASAALATVLDPSAFCPENVSTTLDPISSPQKPILLETGVSVTEHIFKSTRGNPCESCGFQKWNIGDIKYIVEHWENPETEQGGREHLCLSCAVNRGIVGDYQDSRDNDTEDTCQGCGNSSIHQIGSCTVEGLLKVHENRSKKVLLLCFTCANDRFQHSLQPSAAKKRKTVGLATESGL